MRLNLYVLQGLLLGLEWDWDNRWVTINLLLVRVVVSWPTDESKLITH
jgi:hypothetical protein